MRTAHFTDPAARERYRALYAAAVATLPPAIARDVETTHGTVRVLTCEGAPSGEPLVLLPGAGAPGVSWASSVPSLLGLGTVHLVDPLGGPGASRQDVPIRDLADQARWLRALLDGLDLASFHLVGTSMGGRIAFELARRAPAGLRTLSLLEPANTFDRIPLATVASSVGAIPGAPGWLRRRFLDRLGDGGAAGDDPVLRLVDAGMSGFASAVPHPPRPSDADLRAVTVPTLVLLGGRSTMLDAGRARERAALLPRGTVEVWPDASHALPGEFPERVAERIARLTAGPVPS
ncbi:alpha/beta fold hydrolase [Pseudonocardia sp. HH130630-07]|uniref:alpha/beta fold hydrolase n=1 Tax=Pseudonocardia sp. HH130630-07 TaxID=1690815 RepID=UPI000815323E|nr:alpha/beta hydrolase [Pseudonocardia sp. HH130630-07]ANY06601.1 hypothetical protein AFB00_10195 [Pseudonocardia sp. HH130630-07]